MGKLNIAHHKSYHPYRRDNIERVRRDEEEAKLKEEVEEGRMMLADAEARMDALRQRAGLSEPSDKKRKDKDDMKLIASSSSMQAAVLPTTNGHINLFEDLEHTQSAIAAAIRSKKPAKAETDKGVALAPEMKDLKPWYSMHKDDKPPVDQDETESERRRREEYRKVAHDPLTSITKQLSAAAPSTVGAKRRPQLPKGIASKQPDVQARLSRESSERQRALDLIRRKKLEREGNATPSSVFGESAGEYGDMYNRREVEEAHRHRDKWRDVGNSKWDEDYNRSRHLKQW